MTQQEEYIREQNARAASNIAEFSIGQNIYTREGERCVVCDKTSNSIMVQHYTKVIRNDKGEIISHGVDCKQWYTMKTFNDKFKTGE